MATLQCNVSSAKETIHSGEISMLIATGVEGEVGICQDIFFYYAIKTRYHADSKPAMAMMKWCMYQVVF